MEPMLSRTYSICCHDCRVELWVGQSPDGKPERFYLYRDVAVMTKLAEFLMGHKGHRLGFDDDERLPDYADWEENDGVWTLNPSVDDL